MNFLPQKLIELREKYGLTQDELAEIMDIGRTTYLSYESGKTMPDGDFLVRLSRLFGIHFEDLTLFSRNNRILTLNSRPVVYNAGRKKNKNITDDEEFLISCYRKLNDLAKEKVIDDFQNFYVDLEFDIDENFIYKNNSDNDASE